MVDSCVNLTEKLLHPFRIRVQCLDFGPGHETCKRVYIDPNGVVAHEGSLDERRPASAERIEHTLTVGNPRANDESSDNLRVELPFVVVKSVCEILRFFCPRVIFPDVGDPRTRVPDL